MAFLPLSFRPKKFKAISGHIYEHEKKALEQKLVSKPRGLPEHTAGGSLPPNQISGGQNFLEFSELNKEKDMILNQATKLILLFNFQ